ncbi:winged helix-turn-helix domain-containing tetratricopeptide repeat protein [Bradyrhizobium monzae]|uniref:winged helix-turn-helix domain-containing tetratricopeptide repeat protein n=1 Tax=Bradyrhizobium sp. Oc8 TaxID=2876780 RepID=UPI001F20FA33|nr:tetratricopeptide repeat protein [Bradyrhizobium sp. Oc8]
MRYLFDDFAFDTVRRELHRGANVVSVAPQVFDLLDYLIRNRERVVSKGDLIDAIWNGRSVSDAALTTRLNVARSVIGDTGEDQRLIKTLPRKDFRFVAPVVEAQGPADAETTANSIMPALTLPNKPSIAVLPFANLSGDPEQDYFADGMVDEIITALSRFKSLFVIARNSSFTYKGRAVDIKLVGRELGVRYVLEGSVRKAAGKVRVTGQLIDAMTGANLWADRFEGDLVDVFALQDEVAVNVVSAIQPRLLQTEIVLAARRPNNLSAYDLCLRAQHLQSWTRGGSDESLRLASRALEIDPRYGFAATLAAECHIRNVRQGWAADPKSEIAEGFRLLRFALNIDGNATLALSMLGRATASFSADFDTAVEMVDRAVALNPNSFRAWEERGWTHLTVGQPEEAIRSFGRRIRLSPFDPLLFATFAGMSMALIGLGRFDEAISAAKKAARQNPLFPFTYRCLASALAHREREAEARQAVATLLELDPDFRISKRVAPGDLLGLRSYIDGLRKAGVPE